MSNEELYQLILKHFENVDKLAEALESLVDKLKEIDERVHTLEIMLPKKDDDWELGEPVLV